MGSVKIHNTYVFSKDCPVCGQFYDCHWKIISHIRKSNDNNHINYLREKETEVIDSYIKNPNDRRCINKILYNLGNIFAGISYERLIPIVHKRLTTEQIGVLRKERISRRMSEIPKTKQHNKNVSLGVKKAWISGKFDTPEVVAAREKGYENRPDMNGENNPMYGKSSPKGSGRGKGGIRSDIGHYVRSTWEANFCRICLHLNRQYLYEPCRFEIEVLGNKYTYCPDFYLPEINTYYELKGHAKSKSNWPCQCKTCLKNKIILPEVIKSHEIKLKIVGSKEYKKLKKRFKSIITGWEK